MIPLFLHQIWFQGQDRLPAQYRPHQKKWRQEHPHFQYQLWDEKAIRSLLERDFQWFLPTWLAYQHMIQKIDSAKVFILWRHGGIYVDMDMSPVRSIDPTGRKLKSTICSIINMGDKWAFLSGRGYGHGVGMCQCGAQGMARQGKTAEQILFHYYPGSKIVRVY